jgi:transposase
LSFIIGYDLREEPCTDPYARFCGQTEAAASSDPIAGAATAASDHPDPEVPSKTRRRKYSVAFKKRILDETDQCENQGEVGALLRREGLYSSNLTTWRRQREEGTLAGLKPKKRGRKANPETPLRKELEALKRDNASLQDRLDKAEMIIDVQKKVSELLGISLKTHRSTRST